MGMVLASVPTLGKVLGEEMSFRGKRAAECLVQHQHRQREFDLIVAAPGSVRA